MTDTDENIDGPGMIVAVAPIPIIPREVEIVYTSIAVAWRRRTVPRFVNIAQFALKRTANLSPISVGRRNHSRQFSEMKFLEIPLMQLEARLHFHIPKLGNGVLAREKLRSP
jgi:hypothetical protein